MSTTDARTIYVNRLEQARAQARRHDRTAALWGHGRLLTVVTAAFLLVKLGWDAPLQQPVLFGAIGLFVAGSLVAQVAAEERRRRAECIARLHTRNLQRMDGDWVEFESDGSDRAPADHPYAFDLDVVGRGSLFQGLDASRTEYGARVLANWLLSPAPPTVVAERRAAVDRLAGEIEAREALQSVGLEEEAERIDLAPVATWAAATPPPPLATWIKPVAFLLPSTTLLTVLLGEAGLWRPIWAIIPAILTLALRRLVSKRISPILALGEASAAQLQQIEPLIQAARRQPIGTPLLDRLHDELEGAEKATKALRRRVSFLESRANLMVMLVAPLLLWELHAAFMLDAWHRRHGTQVQGWLEALGRLEALQAMAAYRAESPDDTWAEFADGPLRFEADQLGHPLLAPDQCVRNDLQLTGAGRALLVTGSNMSGKSTLLRATGLAAVMAQAGLPVRARSLQISPMQVATCMRVTDSLQDGASLFLAEVKRLKRVTEQAEGVLPLLFLLDEILQGTNSRERALGSRGVLEALLAKGAAGLVSTHDLSLATLADQGEGRVECVHFTDTVVDGEMHFDYRMRPGVSQSTNALRVMRSQGLPVPLPEEPEGGA